MYGSRIWFAVEITGEDGGRRAAVTWFYSYTSGEEIESRLCRAGEKVTRIAVCGNMDKAYDTADEWRKAYRAA